MKSGIYKITNIVNGKCYIGSSVNVKKRFENHKTDLNKGKHHSKYLQRAWNKYGSEAFKFELLWSVEPIRECLLFEEQQLINHLNPEYNTLKVAGSPLGIKKGPLSSKRKQQISQSMIGNQWNRGKKLPLETRKKLSRKVIRIDPKTLEEVEYYGQEFAAQQNGIYKGTSISAAITRNIKCGGYYWKYPS